jgi:hypothetical protein
MWRVSSPRTAVHTRFIPETKWLAVCQDKRANVWVLLAHVSYKLRRVLIWHVTTRRFKAKGVNEEEDEEEDIFQQILALSHTIHRDTRLQESLPPNSANSCTWHFSSRFKEG